MKETNQSYKSKTRKRKPKETGLNKQTQPQNDVYSRVTNKILADLEKGNLTWRKPWNSDHLEGQVMRPLRWNGIPYSGINTLMLWGTAAEKGYIYPHWMTYDQAIKLKAQVRKDEKGTQVIKVIKTETLKEDDEQTNDEHKILIKSRPKIYTVFNVSQM
jgi:antirestriction protein ArdC